MSTQEKLQAIEEKFNYLETSFSAPDAMSDPVQYAARIKEYHRLMPIMQTYRKWKTAQNDIREAEELLQEPNTDSDIRALAAEEIEHRKKLLISLERDLTVLLLPRDPNDDKNVMVEIRAGTGGEEAALFVSDLFRMYSMYATSQNFRLHVMSRNETELGGYKEIVFMVEGDGAYSRFRFESGVHRVQRIPATESQGRIQTSAATVAVLPEVEEITVHIDPSDLIFESCKSSGAGGQHVNKTESAVRLTHKPTNIVVECDQERSQFKNRDLALKMLRTRLYDREQSRQQDEIAASRRLQVGSGDRSQRIRTYNFPQGRVTDHRIGLTLYSLESFMNGNMNDMIDALISADTAERLRAENATL